MWWLIGTVTKIGNKLSLSIALLLPQQDLLAITHKSFRPPVCYHNNAVTTTGRYCPADWSLYKGVVGININASFSHQQQWCWSWNCQCLYSNVFTEVWNYLFQKHVLMKQLRLLLETVKNLESLTNLESLPISQLIRVQISPLFFF